MKHFTTIPQKCEMGYDQPQWVVRLTEEDEANIEGFYLTLRKYKRNVKVYEDDLLISDTTSQQTVQLMIRTREDSVPGPSKNSQSFHKRFPVFDPLYHKTLPKSWRTNEPYSCAILRVTCYKDVEEYANYFGPSRIPKFIEHYKHILVPL